MFQTSKKQDGIKLDKIDTIIGANSLIEGSIRTEGVTRVDGSIKGKVFSSGLLIIGSSGNIEGDIKADSMVVSGQVTGNIQARERLEITSSGIIAGDIVTPALALAEGAIFEGSSSMRTLDTKMKPEPAAEPVSKSESVEIKSDKTENGKDKKTDASEKEAENIKEKPVETEEENEAKSA